MGTYGLKAYLAAHQKVVGVAVSTVVTAGTENTVEQGSSSEIQLVLVAGSGVRQDTLWLGLCYSGSIEDIIIRNPEVLTFKRNVW